MKEYSCAIGCVALVALALSGCGGSVVIPRNPEVYPGGISNPRFIDCRHAVNGAYRRMVALKKSPRAYVTYTDWSKMNASLASAISAMEFGDYKRCLKKAYAVGSYIYMHGNFVPPFHPREPNAALPRPVSHK